MSIKQSRFYDERTFYYLLALLCVYLYFPTVFTTLTATMTPFTANFQVGVSLSLLLVLLLYASLQTTVFAVSGQSIKQ